MSVPKTKDDRRSIRHPLKWKVAVVFDKTDNRPTFHGVTHDISVDGASILTDLNIYAKQTLTMLLAIPPLHTGQRKTIVEIRARMMYTVLSSEFDCFRIGFHFESFKGDGRNTLEKAMSIRAIMRGLKAE